MIANRFMMAHLQLRFISAAVLLAGNFAHCSEAATFPHDPLAWPPVSATTKPWTRWWWLGSAVDPKNLTRQLEDFAEAGIGGVEICPIYGAKGEEGRFIDYLSPAWMNALAHTTTEGKRLDLGVDMTTGTGWPFGGPQVSDEMASVGLKVIRHEATGGRQIQVDMANAAIVCLRAFDESNRVISLESFVTAGKLTWSPPAGRWQIIGLLTQSPIQKVKRAAPGGEGSVVDPFSSVAMERYLKRFDAAFRSFTAPMPRAQFHDSFEYYAAEWTPQLLNSFLTSRG